MVSVDTNRRVMDLPGNNTLRLVWVPGYSNVVENKETDTLSRKRKVLLYMGPELKLWHKQYA